MNEHTNFYLQKPELEDNEMTEIWERKDQPEEHFESADNENRS